MSTPARRRSSNPPLSSTAASTRTAGTSAGTAAVRRLPTTSDARVGGVRLADAVALFLATITVANTRRGYAAALQRLVADFGADTDVAGLDPDRVAGWFTFAWGGCAAKNHGTITRRPRPMRARLLVAADQVNEARDVLAACRGAATKLGRADLVEQANALLADLPDDEQEPT